MWEYFCSSSKSITLDDEYEAALRKALSDMKSMLTKEKKISHILRRELSKMKNAYDIEKTNSSANEEALKKQTNKLRKLNEQFEIIKQRNVTLNDKLVSLTEKIVELENRNENEHKAKVKHLMNEIDELRTQLSTRQKFLGLF